MRVVPFMKGDAIYVRVYITDEVYYDFNYEQAEKLNEDLNEILACDPGEDL